jgi:hypothetical protein
MKDSLGGELYGEAYARATDPGTSHAAAKSMEAEANNLERLFADTVAPHPNGLTTGQVATLLKLDWQTISPRAAPLKRKGILETRLDDAGKKITRKGSSGRSQEVLFRTNKLYDH